MFSDYAEYGDEPAYKVFWERVMKNRDKVKYSCMEEGINDMFEDQVVIHIDNPALKQYYTQHPTRDVPTMVPSEGEINFGEYLILTENSPLGPILEKELKQISEAGMSDITRIKWIGRDLPQDIRIKVPDALD